MSSSCPRFESAAQVTDTHGAFITGPIVQRLILSERFCDPKGVRETNVNLMR